MACQLRSVLRLVSWALSLALAPVALAQTSFVAFESDPVRPLALSPDGSRLFAVNTPDDHLEIFDIAADGTLIHRGSVPVGMEPVAVAARPDEVWVVNHLSDSVSIVRLDDPRVVRTLYVGDEPRDIVFAGPERSRAFVTTAHRGQHSPTPRGDYTTPGVGRADVWVFDADAPGAALGGEPLAVLTVFGDRPRALAVSPDGATVHAAVFRSGNQTTSVTEGLVCDGGSQAPACTVSGTAAPGGLPAPNDDAGGLGGPETGLIVRFEPEAGPAGEWRDELGRDWSDAVRFDLPDLDVFEIDALASPPAVVAAHAGVGTVLFDMAVNPQTGVLYVSGTEARNEVRFEGEGLRAAAVKPPGESPSVQGHLHEARITVIADGAVLPRHLNKHIDYAQRPAPDGVSERSLATPLDMAVSPDGETLYVAAFGSGKIGVFSTAELEADSFVPDAADHIELTGGGPVGLVLRGERLYVLTRFDDHVSVVDLESRSEVQRVALHDPEPPHVVEGRPFLYDARLTSSNGEASCSSCHVFGDMDDLAWDLGDPDAVQVQNPNPTIVFGGNGPFHPLKGPMTTQTLRGLATHGPMHWRGDRTGGNADPPVDPLDEAAAFRAFNVAFPGLLGREAPLSDEQMQAFTDFALALTLPPNPIRRLDGSLRPDETAGRDIFLLAPNTDAIARCVDCHVLDPSQGFFGTSGRMSFENEPQNFKVAHLRNLYQKVGMFGMAASPMFKSGDNDHMGDQVRGFGFLHDGSADTLFRFLNAGVFSLDALERAQVEAFLLAFDSDLAPIVGQQVTLRGDNAGVAGPQIDLLLDQAARPFPSALLGEDARACELIAKLRIAGEPHGFVRREDGSFEPDDGSAPLDDAGLRALAAVPGQELTYTCAPWGSGERMGVNRDGDLVFDGLDNCPAVANDDQLDDDGDGIGNACEVPEPGAGLLGLAATTVLAALRRRGRSAR